MTDPPRTDPHQFKGGLAGLKLIACPAVVGELADGATGDIDHLSYGGDLDTCICIRTVIVRDGVAHVPAGAGIAADSAPEKEYAETWDKAAALLRAIDLAREQFGDGGTSS